MFQNYTQTRRRRREQMSYQAYLAGVEDELVAAETAAAMSPTTRAIVVGVVTGALTLIVNRWLERLFK